MCRTSVHASVPRPHAHASGRLPCQKRVATDAKEMERAMKAAAKPFEYRIYEGAGHAFFNDTTGAYDVKAARDSFARLLGFFARILGG